MGPPGFKQCYLCKKEFGSNSIAIHQPQCLLRWKAINMKLAPNQRQRTPSPSENQTRSQSLSILPIDEPLNTSWPRSETKLESGTRPRSSSHPGRQDFRRPSTATLRQPKRPSTIRLHRQTSRISVPVINTTSRVLPRRGKTATIKSHIPLRKRMMIADDILAAKQKLPIPEPCNTCGKDQNPERFHTHPESAAKFKAKLKLNKDRKLKENGKSISKLAVTKPTALRYKSGLIKDNIETSNELNKKKEPYPKPDMKYQESNRKKQRRKPSLLTHPMKNNHLKLENKNVSSNPEVLVQIPENNEEEIQKIVAEELENAMEPTAAKEQKNNKATATGPKSKSADGHVTISDNKRPTRVCYICGREFGSLSLKIHEPQCLEKWKRLNDNLEAHLRRAPPTKPDKDLTAEEWNEHAWKMAQQQLVPCDNCGRTFFPERLEVHKRGCKPVSGGRSSQPSASESKYETVRKLSSRPTVVCYICGRNFGSRSITIHEPQCIIKWRHESEKLPSHLRTEEPKRPEILYNEKGKVDREAMSEAAWKSHLETLVKCNGCSRTFYPDRLQIHEKSCLKAN